jgi:DNA topoisomerase III
MQIQEFNQYVKDHIKEYLPPEYETARISVEEVTKSNDRKLSGLTVLREGENFSPTVYLEPFAEQVTQGHSLGDALREIAEFQTIHHAHTPVEVSTFMDYEAVRPMPDDAERKGLGTPATRAATLEKLVSIGFVERKKKQLLPTEKGINLIAILPDKIKSPILTAEWESMLKQVERGDLSADAFMSGITEMCQELVKEHSAPEERFADLFPDAKGKREAVGTCPRCGAPVYEGQKVFFCDNRGCSFVLWKDNKFFTSKKKTITKSVAAALLKEGHISMSGLYSEKTGKTYDAVVVLDDTGGKYVNFKLEFPAAKGRRK